MNFFTKNQLKLWLSQIHPQVWILAVGRFLSAVGSGFTLFYVSIFFVNQVGLSATSVGFALGCASLAGIAGRILGGSGADSPRWGRRRILLLSTAISAIGSLLLAATSNFATLVFANVVDGFGVGLYWPATEAVVADLTPTENRREAFALTRLADNLGLGMGIIIAGALIANTGNYRLLFIIDALSFIIFFGVVYLAIGESYQPQTIQGGKKPQLASWTTALRNPTLQIFVIVNIIFTTYISQLHSTLPLYLKNFVPVMADGQGFTESTISGLFAWHLILCILFQIPVVKVLKNFSHTKALSISALLWGVAFASVWACGVAVSYNLLWAILALGLFALALVAYTPSAASLVTDLAPESQRGVYLSINSLCWAAGYFIGPLLGGRVLDLPQKIIYGFWLGCALSVVVAIAILQRLRMGNS